MFFPDFMFAVHVGIYFALCADLCHGLIGCESARLLLGCVEHCVLSLIKFCKPASQLPQSLLAASQLRTVCHPAGLKQQQTTIKCASAPPGFHAHRGYNTLHTCASRGQNAAQNTQDVLKENIALRT